MYSISPVYVKISKDNGLPVQITFFQVIFQTYHKN